MIADLIIYNIKTIYTPYEKPPVHGKKMSSIHEIHQAFIAIKDGLIIEFGAGDYVKHMDSNTLLHDAKEQILLPGFIDSHTHLVHGGSREDEYKLLQQGVPYLDILKNGGGILGTVQKTRDASINELYLKAYHSLDEMMLHGVTTVESKSGYGLSLEHETKQLLVNKMLEKNHPVQVLSTYMGAHAVPKEYLTDKIKYIENMKHDLSRIQELALADAVDVFCETGVFSIEETKDILTHAKKLGFRIKMHADEIHSLGGAGLGVDLGCTSVDHLMAVSDEDILKLAHSHTIANLLPGTSFYLNKNYARARQMIDSDVAVAISGDYNPGSCPTENFQLIMQLASNKLKMTPEEVLNAVTINPAYHLGLDSQMGSIEIGKKANLVILNAPNLSYILYHFGINHTNDVIIDGKIVVKNRQIVREI